MTTAEPDVVDKYLIDINIPRDSVVPLEVFIAFPETLTDINARETIRKYWLYGNDKQVASMDLMFSEELTCIYRPVGLRIDWASYVIATITPSGFQIVIPNRFLTVLGNTTEERVANLNDYLFVKLRREKTWLEATEVVPLRGKVNVDIAKNILENTKYSPLELFIIGLGYKPINEVIRLFMPRILTWFKGFDGKPMHIAQFTLPESGKTSFGLRGETMFNWRYIPEPPTLARLILDARSGILGEVFLRNGIVFDEFDKWSVDTADRRYTFDSILTGMEQGKWERGVSAMGIRTPDVPRLIPITFFGNLGDFEKLYGVTVYNTRAFFNTIYTARLGHDVRALCDRLAVVDASFKHIRVMNHLTSRVLPDGVMRGMIQIIQERVKPCNVSKMSGRLKRHADNAYAILSQVMNCEATFVDNMVSGGLDLDKALIPRYGERVKDFMPTRE